MATNASRDTTTGTTKEKKIEKFLVENTTEKVAAQVVVGVKRNGGKHYVDLLLGGETYLRPKTVCPISKHKGGTLVSSKLQETSGTAEEKIPFEFMKLHHCIVDYDYDGAIIVLSGDTGWDWKDYFLGKEFKDDMKKIYPDVQIMSEEEFYTRYSK